MSVITNEDLDYLVQQSTGKLNMALAGMTTLLQNNDEKIEKMASQNWFQRMVKTVTGKNRATAEEIRKNHEKLNAYMAEAVAELYNRNCVDEKMITSLGQRINEVYTEQLQLKQMLGAFVQKLNQKIESIDNFHMLNTEIEQGIYNSNNSLNSICKVLSQLDNRTVKDDRKLGILERALHNNGIISEKEVTLVEYLVQISEASDEETGIIYLELSGFRDNVIAQIILEFIENYHMLPDLTKKMKSVRAVAEETLVHMNFDTTICLSTKIIYDELIASKVENANEYTMVNSNEEELLKNAETLFVAHKMAEALELLKEVIDNSARAKYLMYFYYENVLIKKDKEKSKKYCKEASEAGDVLARRWYATFLDSDAERNKIYVEILPSIIEMAHAGDVFAMYEFAFINILGDGVEKDINQGLFWLKMAADNGLCNAMDWYGQIYYYGNFGIKKDYFIAKEYYEKAAYKGYECTYKKLGLIYYKGNAVERNYTTAAKYFKMSCEAGDGYAAMHLGWIYKDGGYGEEKSISKAMEYYELAVEMGCKLAYKYIAKLYGNYYTEFGLTYKESFDPQRKYYYKAYEDTNDAESAYKVAEISRVHYDVDLKDIWELYLSAAENNYKDAMAFVLGAYSNGYDFIEKNPSKALEWAEKLAEVDGFQACMLGYVYGHRGSNPYGVSQNMEKARYWYKKSIELGYEFAKDELALLED